jgi:3-deoxy-D-manno-octulosonic acid kinase
MFQRLEIDRGAILFDSARVAAPGPHLFERDYWRARGALSPQRGGRGSVDFIECGRQHWVMRHYLRGGMAARLAHDRYLYAGENRTRSFRELRLLGALRSLGLPVPAPVAGWYRRGLLTYTATLITEALEGARSLARALAQDAVADTQWSAIGRTLRRFHDAGVQHADLNAHNVMLGEKEEVWLLDFDRGRLREPGPWRERSLDRLARSLRKLGGDNSDWARGFDLLRRAHDS